MNRFAQSVGKWIATYLSKQIQIENTAPPINPLHLQANLLPGDVLLVEGNTRLSTAIKYLTQSTWSHAESPRVSRRPVGLSHSVVAV